MATPKEINEFEELGEFFKRLRQDCQFQGKSLKESIADDTALKRKYTRLKNLGIKVKEQKKIQQQKANAPNDEEKNEYQMMSIRKSRKRRYSECTANDTNIPQKRLKLSRIRNNIGFSPSLSFNRRKPQSTNTANTGDKETEDNTQNIQSNNTQTTKRKSGRAPLNIQTPSTKNINRNIGLLSNRSSLKKRINFKAQQSNDVTVNIDNDDDDDEHDDVAMISDGDADDEDDDDEDDDVIIESNRNNKNTKKSKPIPQTVQQSTKTRRKTVQNHVESKTKKKKEKKRPQTVKAKTKVTKKTVKKKKNTSRTSKKTSAKRKTKKDGAGVSKNFVRMDLKHNNYRRKGRPNRPTKFKQFNKFAKFEWMKQQKRERAKKNNLNLENEEQLKLEVNSDSEDQQDSNLDCIEENPKIRNEYCDRLNEIKNDEEIDDLLVDVLQKEYGYNEYRNGQKEAIKLILQQKSVLLLLSTGAGKSLCYQIPTILFNNDNLKPLTLVISPLISLMYDQCNNLPSCLKGRVWDSSLEFGSIMKLRNDIVNGHINVLYIAPEKLDSNYFQSFLKNCIGSKRLMFACIDEAHCISEWSHNFRPSYLKLKRILMDYLCVGCILACTATATVITQNSIRENLCIQPEHVINSLTKRENLHLTASHVGRGVNKQRMLVNLLRTERFRHLKSLIVYACTVDEVNRLAIKLGILKRHNGTEVAGYHSRIKKQEKMRTQNGFMNGDIHIIVATIAFGMGVNKSDVRGVLHYSVPKSMEEYVQQIGRAGRDGLGSECHMFYDQEDIERQRSWIHKNGVDLMQIKRILFDIFSANNVKILRNRLKKNKDKNNDKTTKKRRKKDVDSSDDDMMDATDDDVDEELILTEFKQVNDMVAMPKSGETARKYDANIPVLETVFTYLDVYKSEYIKLLPTHHNRIKVGITHNAKELEAESEIIRFIVNCYSAKNGIYNVHLDKLYNDLRHINIEDENGDIIDIQKAYTVYEVLQHLKHLKFKNKLTLDYEDKCFVLMIMKTIHDHSELVSLCDDVLEYVLVHETSELEKINTLAQALKIIANSNDEIDDDDGDIEKKKKNISLHELVKRYFECENHDEFLDLVQSYLPSYEHIRTQPVSNNNIMYAAVKQSITKFLLDYPKIIRSRTIAKIFHGFASPLYPWKKWAKNMYWKKHVNFPFLQIMEIAKEVMQHKKNKKKQMKNNDMS